MKGLKWTTAGESHGKGLVGVLEGLPAGFALDVAAIDAQLARRQAGYGRGGRMAIEHDRIEVLAGLRAGRTLGSPLALLLPNKDARIEQLEVPTSPRPGHADLAGCQKFASADPRAVLERASARETAMRVALAAAARQVLEAFGVVVFGHVVELGGLAVGEQPALDALRAGRGDPEELGALRAASDFACLDPSVEPAWRAVVDAAAADGDTLGGLVEVVAWGLPPGLGGFGDPRERLTSRLAGALMSIPALKGVEFGLGFEAARRRGSEVHDEIVDAEAGKDASTGDSGQPGASGPLGSFGRFARASNRAGGLEGGMTTGAPLVVRCAKKPISTLKNGLETRSFGAGEAVRSTYQRSDVTAVPAASVVAEALVALELTAAFLEAHGAASYDGVVANHAAWRRAAAEL